jgi:hypothetical protein
MICERDVHHAVAGCGAVAIRTPIQGTLMARYSQTKSVQRVTLAALVGLMLSLVAGCDRKPRAPVLRDSPVYQNNREGFRFRVPERWTQTASSMLPEDELEGEVVLVQYRMPTAVRGASMEILCFEEAEPSNLRDYHAGPSHGVRQWMSRKLAEEPLTEINGIPAERFAYQARVGKQIMFKDVVCFRRQERVYSFIGLSWEPDTKAREQFYRAVDSTIWKD